ncbi:hypothetical protein GGR03_000284 [Aurantimonas endophytica]|uniref:Uncharacterized protein n=1 Tax=Aurantimonas endophytica TaxID=1522175 RepID=A0A7W6HA11_9HYPH|nr:hypothetical protein [Aurantimonas endophytica]
MHPLVGVHLIQNEPRDVFPGDRAAMKRERFVSARTGRPSLVNENRRTHENPAEIVGPQSRCRPGSEPRSFAPTGIHPGTHAP